MTFWGVRAGTLGMGFDGEGVLQQSLLGRDILALLPEVLDIEFDGFPCHRYRLIDRLPVGDATGKQRHGHGIPSLRLSPEEDAVRYFISFHTPWILQTDVRS